MTEAPRYPHCKHCCWGHEHHPDDAEHHDTPCGLGCIGHSAIKAAS